jgi:FkbM family methyltransferase
MSPVTPRLVALAAGLGLLLCAAAEEPKAAPRVPERPGAILKNGHKVYSQSNEELIIRDFFGDRRKGFFLDVGCAWPSKANNTYYLERFLGWKGIGIDALPEYGELWKNRRPKSKFFNYLITDHAGTVESFFRSPHTDVSSIFPNGPWGKDGALEELHVPTMTLDKLLDDNHVASVDLVSMDIEGAEPLALKGFDIKRFKTKLVCIEVKGMDRQPIEAYFAANGYARILEYEPFDQVNYYYTPKANPPQPAP